MSCLPNPEEEERAKNTSGKILCAIRKNGTFVKPWSKQGKAIWLGKLYSLPNDEGVPNNIPISRAFDNFDPQTGVMPATQDMEIEDLIEDSLCREVIDPIFNGIHYDNKPLHRSIREETLRYESTEYY